MPLIDLYDNVLIYNPNIFFPVIISVGILILILIINLAFLLGKKITIVPKEINNNLRKIKRIKLQKVYRIRLSPTKLMINIIKSIIKIVMSVSCFISNVFKYSEKLILKLSRIIGKEILID